MPLFVFILVVLLGLPATADEPDPVTKRLIKAKEDFLQACKTADEEVLHAIEEQMSSLTSEGDLERATKLKTTREAYEKQGVFPTEEVFLKARMAYANQFLEARQAVEQVFDDAISELTKAGNLTRATAVQSEKKRWLDVVKSRKTPTTRYQSPVAKGAVRWEKNGHYYQKVNIRGQSLGIAWPNAKAKCEEMGGYLACGETPEEVEFLQTLSQGAWTGGYKDKRGQWVWLTGPKIDTPPRGDGKDFGFAKTDPQGLLAVPEHGLRSVRTWEFICEWDE